MSRFLREIGLRHREWILAHEERERERASWADFFQRFDVLLCPVAPVPAVRHDHREPMLLRTVEINGGARPYTDLLVWPGVIGVAHLPASVAPVGRTRDGLPVGIQIVAPVGGDLPGRPDRARLRRESRSAARRFRGPGGSVEAGLKVWGGAPEPPDMTAKPLTALLRLALTLAAVALLPRPAEADLRCDMIPNLMRGFFQNHVRFNERSEEIERRTIELYVRRLDPSPPGCAPRCAGSSTTWRKATAPASPSSRRR